MFIKHTMWDDNEWQLHSLFGFLWFQQQGFKIQTSWSETKYKRKSMTERDETGREKKKKERKRNRGGNEGYVVRSS